MTRKSPFPGMDPYLERNPTWEDIHGWFIRKLAEQIMPRVRGLGMEVGVERSVYRDDPDGGLMLVGEPNLLTFQNSAAADAGWDRNGSNVMVAEPHAIHEIVLDDDETTRHKQDYLVIREELSGWVRVVAVVELLSPANKTRKYASKYREKWSHFLASRSHFLEIDLLRDGENPSRRRFPELAPTPYFIFLAWKNEVGRNKQGFPVRLQDRLPTIGLPLTPDRPILPLDLQAAFESAYDLCAFVSSKLYENLPGPELAPEDVADVREIAATRSVMKFND